MVASTFYLFLAIITVHGAFSKKIGGSRFQLFTNKLNSLRLPLRGLISSISGTGAMTGFVGDRFRGGGGEGSTANLGAISHKFDVDNDEKNTKQAGGALLLFSSLLNSYTSLLERSPYPTKMVTSAIIGALGDYLVQKYEGRKTNKTIDLRRLLVFATVCGLYIAPVIHIWFEYLNRMPFLASMGKYSKAFAMMFVDQSVGATVITLGFFFAFEAAQAIYPPYTNKNFLAAGWNSVKSNLGVTMIANWSCWPIINYVNFLLVPLEYRVLFANFAAVFWNMFLSQIANRELPKTA